MPSPQTFHSGPLTLLSPGSLVLVKRGAVLEAEKPLTSQLLMTTLNEGSPYETLHTLISSAVSPFFKSYVRESGKGDRSVVMTS